MDSWTQRLTPFPCSYERLDDFDKDLEDCYKINVVGTINATAAFIPLLKKGSIKKVIALSSGMGDLDFTTELDMDMAVPYSISKAGLNMVMAKFSASYKKDGILFMSLSPGAVDSEDDGRGTNAPVQDVDGDLSQSLYPNRPWHKFSKFLHEDIFKSFEADHDRHSEPARIGDQETTRLEIQRIRTVLYEASQHPGSRRFPDEAAAGEEHRKGRCGCLSFASGH